MTNATNTTTTRTPAVSATIDGTALTLTFANGQRMELDTDRLSPEIRAAALIHGLKQKLVDAAAISRNTDTGASATAEDKFLAVKEVFDRITAADGTWNAVRGTGEAQSAGGMLLRALVRLQGAKTAGEIEAIKGKLASWDAKQKAAVRANPKVAAILAEMAAESAAGAGIDTDALLDGLAD